MLDPTHASEIAELFGLGLHAELIGPVAAGHMGRVWKLTTEHGSFAVKEPFEPTDPEDAERDARLQDVFRQGGVPMPAVRRTRAGRVLGDLEGTQLRVYDFVDVRAPDRRLDPASVGALLARIHQAGPSTDDPVHEWYVAPVGVAAWTDLVERLGSARAPFTDRVSALVPDLVAAESVLTIPNDTRVCHHDLWEDNILQRTDGDLVVLDWEDTGAGSVDHELGMVLYAFGCGEPARIQTLADAYARAGGPGRVRAPGDLTQLVAQSTHILQAACEQWLDAGDEAERTASASWAAEFLDDPVTPRTIELILAALA